jgi:hypothetical protein
MSMSWSNGISHAPVDDQDEKVPVVFEVRVVPSSCAQLATITDAVKQ